MPPGRVRLAPHIYRDRYGFEVAIKRHGKTYTTRCPADSSRAALHKALAALLERVDGPQAPAGPRQGGPSLRASLARWERLAGHLADVASYRAHLRAWLPIVGERPRRTISRELVLHARSRWASDGVAVRTINNRLSALRALFHLLDGDDAPTPCDGVHPLRPHRTPPVAVHPQIIVEVERELAARERAGLLRSARTRARFRVLATTAVRPSELMRAQPGDVDLERAVWAVRDGKGGFRPMGVPLVPAALAAWQLFVAADAWGPFATDSFARALRAAGWPAHIRPYHLRHSLGHDLSARDVDLADISLILGHTRPLTTRTHYVGPQWRRMVAAMATIASRIDWLPAEATSGEGAGYTTSPENTGVSRSGRPRREKAKAG